MSIAFGEFLASWDEEPAEKLLEHLAAGLVQELPRDTRDVLMGAVLKELGGAMPEDFKRECRELLDELEQRTTTIAYLARLG